MTYSSMPRSLSDGYVDGKTHKEKAEERWNPSPIFECIWHQSGWWPLQGDCALVQNKAIGSCGMPRSNCLVGGMCFPCMIILKTCPNIYFSIKLNIQFSDRWHAITWPFQRHHALLSAHSPCQHRQMTHIEVACTNSNLVAFRNCMLGTLMVVLE